MRTLLVCCLLCVASVASAQQPTAIVGGRSYVLRREPVAPPQHGRPAWSITWSELDQPSGGGAQVHYYRWSDQGLPPRYTEAWIIRAWDTSGSHGAKWIRSTAQNPPSGLHQIAAGLAVQVH